MLRALTICCLLVPAVSAPAAAAEWHFTPMFGATFLGRTSLVDIEFGTDDVHPEISGSVALLPRGILGVEGLVVWTPGFFQSNNLDLVKNSRTVALMGNLMLTTPRRWNEYTLHPFVSGGFGLLNASSNDVAGLSPIHTNIAGFNIGGGAIGFLSPRTGLRFELRYYSGFSGTDQGPVAIGDVHLRYMTASVGVVLRR
jgi:hypothetical protein